MKRIKKKHVVDTKRQEHVYCEKKILEEICSPFIVKLFHTFKDSKCAYMLLEAYLGELWRLLRDRQNPTERLGNLRNGINDIRKHRWLNGFNWDGLQLRKLTSPLKRELSGPTDYSYFDCYAPEEGTPPDELSGWDKDF